MKYLTLPLLLLASVSQVSAYEIDIKSKLKTNGTEIVYKNTSTKGRPIHENLIIESVLAAKLPGYSDRDKLRLIEELVLGVRWNDDPLHMFRKHVMVGILSFSHSCKQKISKKIDVRWDLFYRTHCGDMQFLHSMASSESEVAADTYYKMLAWLEFTYKVATGAIPVNLYFRSIQYRMSERGAEQFKTFMISDNNGRSKWRAAGMFSFDCTRTAITRTLECEYLKFSRETIQNIALGSLLHVLQDSYSNSHTKRNMDGEVQSYGAYTLQDKGLHAERDRAMYEAYRESLILTSARIIENVISDREREYPFDTVVRPNLDSWKTVKDTHIEPSISPIDFSVPASDLGLAK